MYGKNLLGHTSLVLRPIKALLLLLFPAFEGLHDNIKFVIIACIQRKLFKGNDRQDEREQTIVFFTEVKVALLKLPINVCFACRIEEVNSRVSKVIVNGFVCHVCLSRPPWLHLQTVSNCWPCQGKHVYEDVYF